MQDKILLEKHLEDLMQEHEELDKIIGNPIKMKEFSEFTVQKLKKRKLVLKDKICRIEDMLNPDIIA